MSRGAAWGEPALKGKIAMDHDHSKQSPGLNTTTRCGFWLVMAAMAIVGLGGCASSPPANSPTTADHVAPPANDAVSARPKATLWVKGLACPFCVHNIDKQLKEVPGVLDVDVELETGRVVVVMTRDGSPRRNRFARP